jgi:hypothetical protein
MKLYGNKTFRIEQCWTGRRWFQINLFGFYLGIAVPWYGGTWKVEYGRTRIRGIDVIRVD